MFEQDYIMRVIKEMVEAGNINEAENQLDDLISCSDRDTLKVALLFYSYLNDKPDEFLEANNFSRDEVKLGLENVADRFGLGGIAELMSEE